MCFMINKNTNHQSYSPNRLLIDKTQSDFFLEMTTGVMKRMTG